MDFLPKKVRVDYHVTKKRSFERRDVTIERGRMASAASATMRLPPVDRLKEVRAFPVCKATKKDTRLRNLAPREGAPMVIHLFTG